VRTDHRTNLFAQDAAQPVLVEHEEAVPPRPSRLAVAPRHSAGSAVRAARPISGNHEILAHQTRLSDGK